MTYKYLDIEKLKSLDADVFNATKPFPWSNPQGVLTSEGFETLMKNLPPFELFTASFGVPRNFNQAPHDRYELFYDPSVPVPQPWKDFIAELESDTYKQFIRAYFRITEPFVVRYQWHLAVVGCSVSPHVDSYRKIASQLFYLNTSTDWNESWGGSTYVLSDTTKKFKRESAPSFDEFDTQVAAQTLNNRSFLFKNTEDAWHGVYPMTPPPNTFRRMFAVIIDKVPPKPSPLTILMRKLKALFK